MVPISTFETNASILKKISTLAGKRQVTWTGRAATDVLNENLTPDDVLDAIVSYIKEKKEVHKSITRKPPHTGKVIFEMLPVIMGRKGRRKVDRYFGPCASERRIRWVMRGKIQLSVLSATKARLLQDRVNL